MQGLDEAERRALERWFVLLEKGVFHRFKPTEYHVPPHDQVLKWKMKALGYNRNDPLQQQFWSVAHCPNAVPSSCLLHARVWRSRAPMSCLLAI
jgi:hypothetical protein